MDTTDRDTKDLQDPNLRVFQFRDFTVLRFHLGLKRLLFGENANECMFIPEDFELMQKFLQNCKDYIEGKIPDFENITVY